MEVENARQRCELWTGNNNVHLSSLISVRGDIDAIEGYYMFYGLEAILLRASIGLFGPIAKGNGSKVSLRGGSGDLHTVFHATNLRRINDIRRELDYVALVRVARPIYIAVFLQPECDSKDMSTRSIDIQITFFIVLPKIKYQPRTDNT
jgi:hypothetical protein